MIDVQRLVLLLKQGKVVAGGEIAGIKIAVKKKNDGKKLTPKQNETFNAMSGIILEEVIENSTVFNLTRNALKKKNSGLTFF